MADRVKLLKAEIRRLRSPLMELRMKDKIVPMFENEMKKRYGKTVPVKRITKELFHINKKIFIINSKDSIPANILSVLIFRCHEKLQITQG